MRIFNGYGPGDRWTNFDGRKPEQSAYDAARDSLGPVPHQMQNLDQSGTLAALERLTDGALDRMAELLLIVKGRRLAGPPPAPRFHPDRLADGWKAMANFVLGAAHAMAARAALRTSRGHVPFAEHTNVKGKSHRSGGTPAHGAQWHAADGAALERMHVVGLPVVVRDVPLTFKYNPLLMSAERFAKVASEGPMLVAEPVAAGDARPARLSGYGQFRVSER